MTVMDFVEPTQHTKLIGRVNEITPLLRAEAPGNEQIGRLGDTTVAALTAPDLLHFAAPQVVGGLGLRPTEALQVLERLSIADGAAGWVAMVTNSLSMMLTYLDPTVAVAMCANGAVSIAGQGAPTGVAKPTKDGYAISGRWSYASGFHLADYVMASCLLADQDGALQIGPSGAPCPRIFLVPATHAQAHGNWEVLGLKATGSVDYSLTDVPVSADYAIDIMGQKPQFGGLWASVGFIPWALLGHTSSALGIARHALDDAARIASLAKGPFPAPAENERLQAEFARKEAALLSARAFVFEQWHALEEDLEAGRAFTTRHETLLRLALLHTTNAAEAVVTWAYRIGGGVALRESDLQRCLRDIHAATQHLLIGDTFYKDCGQELIGQAENKVWTLLGLA